MRLSTLGLIFLLLGCSSTEQATRVAEDPVIRTEPPSVTFVQTEPTVEPIGEITMPKVRLVYEFTPGGPYLLAKQFVVDRRTDNQVIRATYLNEDQRLQTDTWPLNPYGTRQTITAQRASEVSGRERDTTALDSIWTDLALSALAEARIEGEGKEQEVTIKEQDPWPWYFFGLQRVAAHVGLILLFVVSGGAALRIATGTLNPLTLLR